MADRPPCPIQHSVSAQHPDLRWQYIREGYDGKSVICFLCNCTIPRTNVNIVQHLGGERHENREKVLDSVVGLDYTTYSFAEQFRIANALILEGNNGLKCSLCNCSLTAGLGNVEQHLGGLGHRENEDREMDVDDEEESDESDEYEEEEDGNKEEIGEDEYDSSSSYDDEEEGDSNHYYNNDGIYYSDSESD